MIAAGPSGGTTRMHTCESSLVSHWCDVTGLHCANAVPSLLFSPATHQSDISRIASVHCLYRYVTCCVQKGHIWNWKLSESSFFSNECVDCRLTYELSEKQECHGLPNLHNGKWRQARGIGHDLTGKPSQEFCETKNIEWHNNNTSEICATVPETADVLAAAEKKQKCWAFWWCPSFLQPASLLLRLYLSCQRQCFRAYSFWLQKCRNTVCSENTLWFPCIFLFAAIHDSFISSPYLVVVADC